MTVASPNPKETPMRVLKAIPLFIALTAGASCAFAAADFVTIRRTQIDVNDAAPRLLLNFTLPSTVNTSSSTANSAVLDIEIDGSEFDDNEAYVNPPTTTCTDNGSGDANQAASVGILQEHDDANLKTEWATNHMTFSSALLKSGTNQLMICIRNTSGQVGTGAGNLDDIIVRNAVIHYHTTQ
jgi:hypothetical protein